MNSSANTATGSRTHVQVLVHGPVPRDDVEYAQSELRALAERQAEPVPFAGLKLTLRRGDKTRRPALAQATLDVDGTPVRAHVAAATPRKAVDVLLQRLAAQLARLVEEPETASAERAAAWQHATEAVRPLHVRKPPEERQIVRRKSYPVATESPDEAAFEMEALDYDFHLFTDSGSGQDSVIYRGGGAGYFLAQAAPAPLDPPTRLPLTVSSNAAPRLTETEARRLLEACGAPFVFYTDVGTGRGCVLYHRYDGNYGLITPAGADSPAPSASGPARSAAPTSPAPEERRRSTGGQENRHRAPMP